MFSQEILSSFSEFLEQMYYCSNGYMKLYVLSMEETYTRFLKGIKGRPGELQAS